MAGPATRQKARFEEPPPVDLDARLTWELDDIVEEADQIADIDESRVASWFYRVPCAGVRYYSYQEWPSPVEGIRRPV